MAMFKAEDMGCWADGTLGHEHVREVIRNLCVMVLTLLNARGGALPSDLCEARDVLAGPMSDDAWEENVVIDYANAHLCEPGVAFEFDSGDLLLTRDFSED